MLKQVLYKTRQRPGLSSFYLHGIASEAGFTATWCPVPAEKPHLGTMPVLLLLRSRLPTLLWTPRRFGDEFAQCPLEQDVIGSLRQQAPEHISAVGLGADAIQGPRLGRLHRFQHSGGDNVGSNLNLLKTDATFHFLAPFLPAAIRAPPPCPSFVILSRRLPAGPPELQLVQLCPPPGVQCLARRNSQPSSCPGGLKFLPGSARNSCPD